jgi:hypothetical protein
MTRRPPSLEERRERVRRSVFVGAIVVIVLLVVGAFAVFGPFLARFGGA